MQMTWYRRGKALPDGRDATGGGKQAAGTLRHYPSLSPYAGTASGDLAKRGIERLETWVSCSTIHSLPSAPMTLH